MSIRFQSPEESNAWAICFASQCPSLSKPVGAAPGHEEKRKKALEGEVARAADAADEMIRAWRERAYGSAEPLEVDIDAAGESTEKTSPDAEQRSEDDGAPDGDPRDTW